MTGQHFFNKIQKGEYRRVQAYTGPRHGGIQTVKTEGGLSTLI